MSTFVPTPTKKAQDIQDAVLNIFGDAAQVQVGSADILRWINMGQREILITNKTNAAFSTTNTVAGQDSYDISSLGALDIVSLRLDGLPLEYMNFPEAEKYIAASDPLKTNQGVPVVWYTWAGLVILYPVPATSGINNLGVYYVKNFTEVTTLTDTLSVPDQYFNALVQYVLAQAYEMDEDSQNSQFKLDQFGNSINKIVSQDQETGRDLYPFITVLPFDDDDYFGGY